MDTVSRREFLRLSGLAGAATVVAACASPSPAPAAPTAVPAAPAAPTAAPASPAEPAAPAATRYNEAPMLADMVARGELPPVEERLPENPFVIEGLDGIGNFGGTMRKGFSGQADQASLGHMNSRGLINVNHEYVIHPYLCESYEVNEDATEHTFRLRRGTKWSDGAPITTEDFRFYYEDLVLNREFTRTHPEALASVIDGERVPAELTLIDDFTFRYTFARPKALFHYNGSVILSGGLMVPSHYLKTFHVDYADADELQAAVTAASVDNWIALLSDRNTAHLNPERPVHNPWKSVNTWRDEFVTAERNPYFWEVDTAGNQLPYLDRVTFRLFNDVQVFVMWCVNGEIDLQNRHFDFSQHYTILKEGEATGGYDIQMWWQPVVFGAHFNMTTKDVRLRELFMERDFRIAVSLAVNRDEMRELLMDGFCENMQYSPPPYSPQYYAKLANAYLDYDPERANALLDGLGYTERDRDGYRLHKDGSGDRLTIVYLGGAAIGQSNQALMLTDYLKDIGLNIVLRGVERALSIEMHQSNEVQMTTSNMDRALIPLADPQIWIKYTNIDDRPWCNAWTAWYIDPSHPIAERPPDGHWIWDIWGYWEELQRTVGEEAQTEVFWKILDIWAEELPSPGFYGQFPSPTLVKNGFKGIHGGYGRDCCTTINENIIDNATWYWEDPENHV